MPLVEDDRGHLAELHQLLILNGVRYSINQTSDLALHNLTLTSTDGPNAILVTVIDAHDRSSIVSENWMQRCIKAYKDTDDVFQEQFLRGIIFSNARLGLSLSTEAKSALERLGMEWHIFLNESENRLLPGPYVLIKGSVYQVSRLYADTHAAFFSAFW